MICDACDGEGRRCNECLQSETFCTCASKEFIDDCNECGGSGEIDDEDEDDDE